MKKLLISTILSAAMILGSIPPDYVYSEGKIYSLRDDNKMLLKTMESASFDVRNELLGDKQEGDRFIRQRDKETKLSISSLAETSDEKATEIYNQIINEYKNIKFEDLYTYLAPRVSYTDEFMIKLELKNELGKDPTEEQLKQRLADIYIGRLSIKDSFEAVKNNLDEILLKIIKHSFERQPNLLKTDKMKVILGLTYLERYYSFEAAGHKAKDILLYETDLISPYERGDALTLVTTLGEALTYENLKGTNTASVYRNKLAWYTEKAEITDFVEAMAGLEKAGMTGNEYLVSASKSVVEERGERALFTKMKTDERLKNYLLPLLNLSSESIYVISTDYTTTFGLTSTYGGAAKEEFKESIQRTAAGQQSFLDFWKRISKTASNLDLGRDIILIDTLAGDQSLGTTTSQRWSKESGTVADPGVNEFITPMNHYREYMQASAEADTNGDVIQFFMSTCLSDNGVNTYTHELTHIYDDKVWLNGHGLRTGVGGEAFARGIFESENNTPGRSGGAFDPFFNLNTAYELDDNRIQNKSPNRFMNTDDLKSYMSGVLDILYSLDIIEAQLILEMNTEDKAVLFNKIVLQDDPTASGRKLDKFERITTKEAEELQTIEDLVDHNIVSGRLVPKGSYTTQTLNWNDYIVVPLFEGVFAGIQNNGGNVGDFLFRRYAHELLGEYGWENGFISYISNQYDNDEAALNAILDDSYHGNMAEFKKAVLQRRSDKLEQLRSTNKYPTLESIKEAVSNALQQDLTAMKNGMTNGPDYYMQWVKEVQKVKTDIFREYLLLTDDFRECVYDTEKEENVGIKGITAVSDKEKYTYGEDVMITVSAVMDSAAVDNTMLLEEGKVTLFYGQKQIAGPEILKEAPFVFTIKGMETGEYTLQARYENPEYTSPFLAEVTYTVIPKLVEHPVILLEETEFQYDGSEKKPKVLSVSDGSIEIPASEYEVAYKDNIEVGEAQVIIIDRDGGNYTVSGNQTFHITEAENPADPDKPVDPEEPIDPDKPVDPEEPIDPDKPVDPEEPIDPDKPVDPEEPIDPDKPVDPEEPIDPDKPVDPEEPIDPEEPEEPTDPGQPMIPDNLIGIFRPVKAEDHKKKNMDEMFFSYEGKREAISVSAADGKLVIEEISEEIIDKLLQNNTSRKGSIFLIDLSGISLKTIGREVEIKGKLLKQIFPENRRGEKEPTGIEIILPDGKIVEMTYEDVKKIDFEQESLVFKL